MPWCVRAVYSGEDAWIDKGESHSEGENRRGEGPHVLSGKSLGGNSWVTWGLAAASLGAGTRDTGQ